MSPAAELAELLSMIPARLWPAVPAALAPCLMDEPPALAELGQVASLAACLYSYNAEVIGAVNKIRASGLTPEQASQLLLPAALAELAGAYRLLGLADPP